MSTGTIIGGISTVVGGGLAGWFGYLAKRATSHGPESVAGGYSKLVSDMQRQHDQLMQRVAGLEQQLAEERVARVGLEHSLGEERAARMILSRQVDWLLSHVTQEQKNEFEERFAGPKNLDTST